MCPLDTDRKLPVADEGILVALVETDGALLDEGILVALVDTDAALFELDFVAET